MTFLIPATLSLTVVSLMVVGGAIFALFLFFPLFLLALVGVVAGTADRTVRRNDPSMDPTRWRTGQ
ncbi:MAG: hypothetical protein ACRDMW_01150 [Gaiellaceae bacterium]